MKLLVIIGGPTAVGKTATSIAVARYFQTEIISADSRQFYKQMNIGTAKPTPTERAKVKHHFVDFLNVWEQYNAADFERDVLGLLHELFIENDVIIMAGGSGLYIDAVCYGFDTMPEVPIIIRENLNSIYQEKGLAYLQNMLHEKDPAYYEAVDERNPQRLIRALEIIQATGETYSSFRKKKIVNRPFDIAYFGLDMPRQLLYHRINQRVNTMIEEGLVEEVKALKDYQHLNSLQTVGYQEIFSYLKGDYSLMEAIELVKRNTRRYAKRQLTWFRRNENTKWHQPGDITGIIHEISSHLS